MPRRVLFTVLACLACAACSQERSRAVTTPGAAKERDYREMIERSRARGREQDALQKMQDAIGRFHLEIGRLPTNITELVIRRYVDTIPTLPANQQFDYKPELGVVVIQTFRQRDGLSPELPPAPDLTNRPTLAPRPGG